MTALPVLVVDDSAMQQALLRIQLGRCQLAVHIADDGPQALALAMAGDYLLILIDCMMPGMDGPETCRRLRAWERDGARRRTPVLGLSALSGDDDRARCLAAGMDAFLHKPLTAAALREALRPWVPSAQLILCD